jgi:hypothetical protein
VAQNLNSMTTTIQDLRTQAEQGIATDVQAANTAIQQIAQINSELQGSTNSDSAAAALEDQRDQDITQLSQLMNISVVRNSNNQISVFTGTGQQLVAGPQASQLSFNNVGTLGATSQWSANASQDTAGTITLVAPGGSTTDLIASNAIQSGEIGAYLQMRDTILPQAQAQIDEFANQMSQALSNQTTSGTAVTSGAQSGYSVDVGSMLPGNSLQLTYTDSQRSAHGHDRLARPGRNGSAERFLLDEPGYRRRLFRRHEFSRRPAQCRAGDPGAVLQSFRHGVAGPQHQWQRQRRQFAVGHVDDDVAHQRQRRAAVVHRRHLADHWRGHLERLADDGSGRPDRSQPRARRFAGKSRGLFGHDRERRRDATEFHP